MSKYFFNLRQHGALVEDFEGAEFPTLTAAHDEALTSIREMVAEMIVKGQPIDGHSLELCHEQDGLLLAIPFIKAIKLAE